MNDVVITLIVLVFFSLIALVADLGTEEPKCVHRPRLPGERPIRWRSCRYCASVASPNDDLCPECLADHKHVRDPFEVDWRSL